MKIDVASEKILGDSSLNRFKIAALEGNFRRIL